MERIAIVAYKPFPGKESELEELMRTHWDILNSEGLVSQRKSIVARASDGTFIEVFGWKSRQAIESAHSNEVVNKMWNDYSKVCEYIPVSDVPECLQIFSEFDPVSD